MLDSQHAKTLVHRKCYESLHLMLSMLGKNSANFSSFFTENRLCNFLQIVCEADILHEMVMPISGE